MNIHQSTTDLCKLSALTAVITVDLYSCHFGMTEHTPDYCFTVRINELR